MGMWQALGALRYEKELIGLLLQTRNAAYGANIFAPLLFTYYFQGSVPSWFLLLFLSLNLLLFFARMGYGAWFERRLPHLSLQEANLQLRAYLLIIVANALLWGVAAFYVVEYGSLEKILVILTLIFLLVSAAIATLSSVFHAIFLFTTIILGAFLAALILLNTHEKLIGVEVAIVAYYAIIVPTAYLMHTFIRDSVRKSREVASLNALLSRKVEEAVRETRRKEKLLQQQTRLAQMGEMISMIAHQWRQPLSAISSAVITIEFKRKVGSLSLDNPVECRRYADFVKERLENIKEYVKVLSQTIDDFRNFFKPDKTVETVSIRQPIQRALSIVESSLQARQIEISTSLLTDRPLTLYPNELMQVILNILKNCEDNFRDKKIRHPRIQIVAREEREEVVIRICDNGGGIPGEILPRIFDPYFSTKEEKNGSGLGLYMSKVIVEEHHKGSLTAYNSEEGACFRIALPIVPSPKEESA